MLSQVIAVGVSVALLSLTPPDQPAPTRQQEPEEPAAAEPGVLAGPKVATTEARKTLVEREFGGKLKRLDTDPAQAALRLLELSDEEKAATDRVLFERAAIMDKLVTDNLREIVEMSQAFQSRQTAEGLRLLKELYDKASDWRARGRLEDELAAGLSGANAAELRRMTAEYVDAEVEELAAEPGRNGQARGRLAAALVQKLGVLGHEIRQSYERTFGAGAKDVDGLLRRLGATPEQESVIRVAIQDAYVTTYGKPTAAQKTAAFLKIYGVLDAEQRKELAKYIGEQRGNVGRNTEEAE